MILRGQPKVKFSAGSKVHEMSTNQISSSQVKKVNLSLGQNFLAAQFILFIDILLKL